MIRPLLFLLATATTFAQTPETETNRFVDLFRPFQTDRAALSPDGRHVAYTLRQGDQLSVVIVEIDTPQKVKAQILVLNDKIATPRFANSRELVPARINWMQWVTDDRVVVETNAQVAVAGNKSIPGIIMAFNADGSDARTLVTPFDVQELVTAEQIATQGRNTGQIGLSVDDPYFTSGGTAAVVAAAAQIDQTDTSIDTANSFDSAAALAAAQEARGTSPLPSGGLFSSDSALSLTASTDDSVIDSLTGYGFNALSPSIFDLDPTTPGSLLIRTNSSAFMVLYRLDTATGKLKQITDTPFEVGRAYLLDRQGIPRISVLSTNTIAFPHRFALERGVGSKRSRDLTTAAGLQNGIGFVVSPENFFTERSIPLGFGEKPEILYYASNEGRDTYGIYGVDLATGQRNDVAIESPELDAISIPPDSLGPPNVLVYDRYTRNMVGVRIENRLRTTRWINPQLQVVQAVLEKNLPGRSVEVFDWDRDGRRFLASVRGPSEPGKFIIFDRKDLTVTDFARRAPWLDDTLKTKAISFTVGVKSGAEVQCQITLPKNQKIKRVPMIVVCPSAPWERLNSDFLPEIQALANMGFAVLQVGARGAWGHGVKQRESIRNGYNETQVADLVDAIDQIGQSFAIDPKRIGLVGSGHGAYVALRAMELFPDRFRCGVVVEPQINLKKWLESEEWTTRDVGAQLVRSYYGDADSLKSNVLEKSAQSITRPIMIMSYPGSDGTWRRSSYMTAKAFAGDVRRSDVTVAFEQLDEYFAAGLPKAKAAVYQKIETFLNENVYDFTVDIGTSVEMK